MPTNNYLITWDPTNKKWTASEDAGAPYDLVERPTVEKITFNAIADPGENHVIFRDSTSDNLVLELPTGEFLEIQDGGLIVGELATFSEDITITNTKQVNGLRDQYGGAFVNVNGMSAVTLSVGEFQWAGTVLQCWARRTGGTGATVNIQVGGSDLKSSDLSLTGTAWTDFSTLQNTAIADGEDCDFEIATVTGTVTQIAFCMEVERG